MRPLAAPDTEAYEEAPMLTTSYASVNAKFRGRMIEGEAEYVLTRAYVGDGR